MELYESLQAGERVRFSLVASNLVEKFDRRGRSLGLIVNGTPQAKDIVRYGSYANNGDEAGVDSLVVSNESTPQAKARETEYL